MADAKLGQTCGRNGGYVKATAILNDA